MLGEFQKRPPAEDGTRTERYLITRVGFRFAVGISVPKIKNPNPPSLSLSSLPYCKIRFQEMLKHLQPSAKELRLFS